MRKLLSLCALLCCATIGKAGDLPTIDPPTLPSQAQAVATFCMLQSDVSVMFNEAADTQVEVYNEQGVCVERVTKRVSQRESIRINATRHKGKYHIVVKTGNGSLRTSVVSQ